MKALTYSLDLTLCCESQRHEINLIIEVSIKFTYFLIQKNNYSAEFSRWKIISWLYKSKYQIILYL